MPFDQVFALIVEQTAPAALAIFSMWMLNRVWEDRLEEAKRNAHEIDQLRIETLAALNRNTEAITRLCEQAK
jgi:hypothetical protein